ncbi:MULTISPECIES: hypothetical protein [Paracoccus]|uniref:hypothetical protein n=1 Tax=Paracoccus TaxID=265 RepID=UPI0023F1FD6E|nr:MULTISPECIES: hypothetical protein [Paracoccus]
MQNIEVLGSFSILDPARLDAAGQAAFAALPTALALPALADLGRVLPEPHPDWMRRLTAEWQGRYNPVISLRMISGAGIALVVLAPVLLGLGAERPGQVRAHADAGRAGAGP